MKHLEPYFSINASFSDFETTVLPDDFESVSLSLYNPQICMRLSSCHLFPLRGTSQ